MLPSTYMLQSMNYTAYRIACVAKYMVRGPVVYMRTYACHVASYHSKHHTVPLHIKSYRMQTITYLTYLTKHIMLYEWDCIASYCIVMPGSPGTQAPGWRASRGGSRCGRDVAQDAGALLVLSSVCFPRSVGPALRTLAPDAASRDAATLAKCPQKVRYTKGQAATHGSLWVGSEENRWGCLGHRDVALHYLCFVLRRSRQKFTDDLVLCISLSLSHALPIQCWYRA